jgi:hypothetical protein
MLIISVVVIAVVAAAYNFVPLFQEGVEDLGQDVKQMLSTGGGRGGGSGMGSGSTARIASRPCDGSAEALRYEAMIAPPPCATPVAKPWAPSAEPALPLFDAEPAARHPSLCRDDHDAHAQLPEPVLPPCKEDPLVYLSSARLGRRSRSRNR